MVTIKDFKVGDVAVALCMHYGRLSKPEMKEVTVTAVGRKFVTVNDRLKYENNNDDFLMETTYHRDATMLFKTREDVSRYLEKRELATCLASMQVHDFLKFSFEELRQVTDILRKEK